MRIGIDGRLLSAAHPGGYRTYTENLIRSLLALDSPHTFVVYSDGETPLDRLANPRLELRRVPRLIRNVGTVWREQITLPRRAARDRLDLFHAPTQTAPLRCPCPLIVTLHDTFSLERLRYPDRPTTLHWTVLSWYLGTVGRLAAHRAAHILTVSESSKRALVRALGIDSARVSVTYEAPAPWFRPLDREAAAAWVEKRFGVRRPFVLHLDSPDGRKNTGVLLEAFARLPDDLAQRLSLVVAGRGATEVKPSRAVVRVLGPVTDDELRQLYNAAAIFAAPSLGEGFGLPALEAMVCGTPVLAADNTSMPEILGDAAMLVPATDVAAWSAGFILLLRHPAQTEALARHGRAHAAAFSWKRCAEQTVALYEQVGEQRAAAASASLRSARGSR